MEDIDGGLQPAVDGQSLSGKVKGEKVTDTVPFGYAVNPPPLSLSLSLSLFIFLKGKVEDREREGRERKAVKCISSY